MIGRAESNADFGEGVEVADRIESERINEVGIKLKSLIGSTEMDVLEAEARRAFPSRDNAEPLRMHPFAVPGSVPQTEWYDVGSRIVLSACLHFFLCFCELAFVGIPSSTFRGMCFGRRRFYVRVLSNHGVRPTL